MTIEINIKNKKEVNTESKGEIKKAKLPYSKRKNHEVSEKRVSITHL